jgi:hypothetical protein
MPGAADEPDLPPTMEIYSFDKELGCMVLYADVFIGHLSGSKVCTMEQFDMFDCGKDGLMGRPALRALDVKYGHTPLVRRQIEARIARQAKEQLEAERKVERDALVDRMHGVATHVKALLIDSRREMDAVSLRR